jgi:hypothetical protein
VTDDVAPMRTTTERSRNDREAGDVEISTLLNLLSTLALVGALIFAALQLRSGNRVREEQAAITLIESALDAVLAQPITLLAEISPHPTPEELDSFGPDVNRSIQEIAFRIETVGYLVYRRVISIESVEDLMGGMIGFWWARIKPFSERDRERTGNLRLYEWVQWLAERIEERLDGEPKEPAYSAHARWQ